MTYAENLSDASDDGENRAPNNSDSDSDGDLAPPPPINEAAARQQRRYSLEELLDEAEHSIEPRVALRMLNEHIQEAFDAAVQTLQPAAAAADARPAAAFVRVDEEQPPDRPPPPPALQRTALSDPLEEEEPAQSPEAPSLPLPQPAPQPQPAAVIGLNSCRHRWRTTRVSFVVAPQRRSFRLASMRGSVTSNDHCVS